MNIAIAAAVFPVIFVGELPDKTMFASLVMAARGHPLAVWGGAAAAFLVHVVIATTIGVGLFHIVPHRVLDAIIAVLFAGGGVYALLEANREMEIVAHEIAAHSRVVTTSFMVIFLAEWGDLTQILTANLAAHYHSPVSVGVGASLALWSVAALAVVSGRGLLRYFPVAIVRRVTAAILFVLAGVALWGAVHP